MGALAFEPEDWRQRSMLLSTQTQIGWHLTRLQWRISRLVFWLGGAFAQIPWPGLALHHAFV